MSSAAESTPDPELLDLAALEATPGQSDPFHYLVVPHFLRPGAIPAVIADFPDVSEPRNHELSSVEGGPSFDRLVAELRSPRFATLLGEKLGVPDLADLPTNISVRGVCEASDGNIHTDHWTKVVTVLVYPNLDWPSPDGKLRLLRSATDLEDYAAEVAPAEGTLIAFRRADNSYHGHTRHEGERRVMQVSWLRKSRLARFAQRLARAKTHALKRLGLHPDE